MMNIEHDNIEKLKFISKITAILAHEIRNPVSSIAGVAQLIRSDKDVLNNEDQRLKIIGIIERESERLTNLVEEFLVYSGSEKRKEEDLDIFSIIKDSCENIRSNKEYISKSINLDLKTRDINIKIKGDHQRMSQAIDNILINAVQASPQKGTITINKKDMIDGSYIYISDNGPGIPNNNVVNIFEPFFTTKEKGTGLGLAIAWNIIKAHGGTISAENDEKSGAVFKIYFPKTNG